MSSAARSFIRRTPAHEDARLREVQALVADLEAFAFRAERVLEKLDLRAAAQARHVARRLCATAPFLLLGVDDELRESAAIELAELAAQARICLGHRAANDSVSPRPSSTPASAVRRRDHRREPTVDAPPFYRGPTHGEAATDRDDARPATEPETDALQAPSAHDARAGRRAFDEAWDDAYDDAAARRQWMSLLGR